MPCCRYVQYYADLLQQPGLQPKRLQLQRVTVKGVPLSDIKDLVVGIWVRPPGVGWKTELLCLAAARPEAMHLEGTPRRLDMSVIPASVSADALWVVVVMVRACVYGDAFRCYLSQFSVHICVASHLQ